MENFGLKKVILPLIKHEGVPTFNDVMKAQNMMAELPLRVAIRGNRVTFFGEDVREIEVTVTEWNEEQGLVVNSEMQSAFLVSFEYTSEHDAMLAYLRFKQ